MIITKTYVEDAKIVCPKCKNKMPIPSGWYHLFMVESNEEIEKKHIYDTLDFCRVCGHPLYIYFKETYPLGYLYPYHQ